MRITVDGQELIGDKALEFALRIDAAYGDEAQFEEQVFAWVREHYPAMTVRSARMVARHAVYRVRRRGTVGLGESHAAGGPALTGPVPGL